MKHPNRVPFEGILTYVDVASDAAPSGARGHRVILTRAAALEALPTLIGMGVNYKADWDGHNARKKVGVIEAADLQGDALWISGYIYGIDFPEVVIALRPGKLSDGRYGMSYEVADSHVVDMRSAIWTLSRVIFTGAAILIAKRAAYRETCFWLTERRRGMAIAAAKGMELRGAVKDHETAA